MNKIALITGASSGIGKAISLELANRNYIVFAGSRTLPQLTHQNIKPISLDVTKTLDVTNTVQEIIQEEKRIDLLINNAGFGYYHTIENGSFDQILHQFDVNFFGTVRMTQAVLPHMRNRREGRIINISSVAGKVTFPLLGYYAATKHASEAFSDTLRQEVEQFGIKVIVVAPGIVKTGFDQTAFKWLAESQATSDYTPTIEAVKTSLSKLYSQAPGPEVVIKPLLKAVFSASPKSKYYIGREAKAAKIAPILNSRIRDFILKKILKF
jgi:short-subunit dehydrogenase